MIFVRGAGSAIAQALAELEDIKPIKRGAALPVATGGKYLFCTGAIRQKPLANQNDAEAADTFLVNAANVMRDCDHLLEIDPGARICVMGSEAAFTGSFDAAYAASKAGLHHYVGTKRLNPDQQLVCVAPTCILNTGMTDNRNEDGRAAMERRRLCHPKLRWLQPIEVARMIHFLLCVDEGYTTGVVIRMNGGEHCG